MFEVGEGTKRCLFYYYYLSNNATQYPLTLTNREFSLFINLKVLIIIYMFLGL